jgi:dynamin GTPase
MILYFRSYFFGYLVGNIKHLILTKQNKSFAESSPRTSGQSGEDWRSAFDSASNGSVDRSSSHNETRSRSADSRGKRYENGDVNGGNSGSRRTPNRLPPAPPGQKY